MGSREDEALERAWQKVEAAWDDDAAHERFIAFCSAQGALAAAGRRYRAVRDADDTRRAAAEKRIDAVLARALLHMELTREPPPPARRWTKTVSLLAVLALMGLALLALLRGVTR